MPRLQPEDVSGELHRIARMPIAGASATMDDAEAEQERANALGQILDLVPSNLLPAAIALLATLPPAVGSRLMERYVDRARKAAAPAILDAVLAVSDAGARMELLEELARKLPRQSIETAAEAARAALPAVERTGEDAEAENAALFQRHRVADVLLVLARRADVPELRLRLAREARDLALTTPRFCSARGNSARSPAPACCCLLMSARRSRTRRSTSRCAANSRRRGPSRRRCCCR